MTRRSPQRMFDDFNGRYFNGEVPRFRVRRDFKPGAPAYCDIDARRIRLPVDMLDPKETEQAVLHEMVHIVTGGASSTRLRRAPSPVVRPFPLGAPDMARLLVRHRTGCSRHGAPGLRSPAHALRRARLARDLLHDRDGTLADERDGHRMGADAVACGPGCGAGGTQEGEPRWLAIG
jgi:hypothetical protein